MTRDFDCLAKTCLGFILGKRLGFQKQQISPDASEFGFEAGFLRCLQSLRDDSESLRRATDLAIAFG
jgi:hypothetical protein